jgi:hypothetical protein
MVPCRLVVFVLVLGSASPVPADNFYITEDEESRVCRVVKESRPTTSRVIADDRCRVFAIPVEHSSPPVAARIVQMIAPSAPKPDGALSP